MALFGPDLSNVAEIDRGKCQRCFFLLLIKMKPNVADEKRICSKMSIIVLEGDTKKSSTVLEGDKKKSSTVFEGDKKEVKHSF